jgi:hypothetical protein
MAGSLDSHDNPLRFLANRCECIVVSVTYPGVGKQISGRIDRMRRLISPGNPARKHWPAEQKSLLGPCYRICI